MWPILNRIPELLDLLQEHPFTGSKRSKLFRDTFHYADSSTDGTKAIGGKLLLHWQDKERSPNSVSHRRRLTATHSQQKGGCQLCLRTSWWSSKNINYLTFQPSNTHLLTIFVMKWEFRMKHFCRMLKCVQRFEKEHLCDWAESWTSQTFSHGLPFLTWKKWQIDKLCFFFFFLHFYITSMKTTDSIWCWKTCICYCKFDTFSISDINKCDF